MAKSRWAGTPSYAKTTDLSGSIISSPVPEKKPTQYSLLQQMPTKTLIGDIAMHGYSQVSSSLAAHLAVRPPLPVAPHHDFWPSKENVYPQPSTNKQWRSTAWFFKQIQANFGGNWYCLIENRFLYTKFKGRSIDFTCALMFLLPILKLPRNAIELQRMSYDFQGNVNDSHVGVNENIFFSFVCRMTQMKAQKCYWMLIKMQKSLLNLIYA